jgi:type IV pilus assembly protein PilB
MLDTENQALRDILLSEGICNEEQLNEIDEEHERSGKPYQEVLVDYEIISEERLLELIAQNLGAEIIDLKRLELTREIVQAIPPETARSYGVIPVALNEHTLTICVKNPLNYQVFDDLRFVLGYDLIPAVAPDNQIDSALERLYPENVGSVHDVIAEMEMSHLDNASKDISEEEMLSQANETPIVRFVDVILKQAIKDKASDIHFEPFEHEFRIRYRVDGALYEMSPPPKSLAIPVISRIKIMSNLNISERRKPQDGRIQLKISGRPIDLRVSCLPTAYGESVVLRILDRAVVNLSLDSLGMPQDVLEPLIELINLPNGILLVTGPTGSGKTTTLYSCINEINRVEDKILTSEDPVEYDIEGIVQVPINEAVGMTFFKALKAFLRQDPDRIMIGEIRDLETAKIAIESSLTGHFVFSTLHTNDAASTVTRLVDMGLEPFLITSSLVAVLNQRLIRKVCSNCKTAYDPTDEDLESLGVSREQLGDRKFYYGKGCEVCNETGYKGRKAIVELLVMSPKLAELIEKEEPASVIKEKAVELGMRTIRQDGVNAVLNGESTLDEVVRYTRN